MIGLITASLAILFTSQDSEQGIRPPAGAIMIETRVVSLDSKP